MGTTSGRPGAEQAGAIIADYHFPQTPALIWRALTDPALLARWLMPNDILPVVGHRFTFQAQPVPGWDGVVRCEVLAAVPPRLLRYSWRGGSQELSGYGHRLDTTVTWTLTPAADGGTDVRLCHDGFTAGDAAAHRGLGEGWRTNCPARLAQVLAAIS